MTPEIEAALASGATILVNAAATDAWRIVRAGFARLFGRGGPADEAKAGRRLDELQVSVEQTDPEQRTDLLEREHGRWMTRLEDLIADDPAAIAELRDLVERLAGPAADRPAMSQTNTASGNSQLFATQGGGSITINNGPPTPPPASH